MASGVQEYFEGFVFRGRPPGDDRPAAWHVEMGRFIDLEGDGRTMLPSRVLTPEQAEAAGFDLKSVLTGINTAALAERDHLVAVLAEREAAISVLTADRDRLAGLLAESAASLDAESSAVHATR